MTYEQSKFLTLEILLEDLDDLEDRQKGKQAAGIHSDLELAIKCMRDDILAAQTSVQDGILALSTSTAALALSTSTAAATDQNVLAAIRNDESVAEQDRRYALTLSNPEMDPRCPPAPYDLVPPEVNDDAVAATLSDLMSRITVFEDPPNGESSSDSTASSRSSSNVSECVSCLEKIHASMFRGSCGHEFCRDCIKQMFLVATKDEELYPPRCCGEVVPPGVAMRVLHYEELRAFSEKAIEWTAKNRLYCAEPTCSKFIPPFAIQDEIGTCPTCGRSTHLTCRALAHPGIDCPMDEVLHGVLEMAEGQNWRRCFHCRAMVELQHGCNHITCR